MGLDLPNRKMYLSKLLNDICPNGKMCLSKLLNVFVQMAKCICPNCKMVWLVSTKIIKNSRHAFNSSISVYDKSWKTSAYATKMFRPLSPTIWDSMESQEAKPGRESSLYVFPHFESIFR